MGGDSNVLFGGTLLWSELNYTESMTQTNAIDESYGAKNEGMKRNVEYARVWHWSLWPHLVGLSGAPGFLLDTACCILSLQRNQNRESSRPEQRSQAIEQVTFIGLFLRSLGSSRKSNAFCARVIRIRFCRKLARGE